MREQEIRPSGKCKNKGVTQQALQNFYACAEKWCLEISSERATEKTRNPNAEIRKKTEGRNPNTCGAREQKYGAGEGAPFLEGPFGLATGATLAAHGFRCSAFGLLSNFGFRASEFQQPILLKSSRNRESFASEDSSIPATLQLIASV